MKKLLIGIFSLALVSCATTQAATDRRGVCLETEIKYVLAPITVIENGKYVVRNEYVETTECVKWSGNEKK